MAAHAATDAVKADAKDRAFRTLWTALGIDLLVAVGLVLSTWVTTADMSSMAAWTALALLLAKSVIQAVASYLLRLKVSPRDA